MNDLLQSLSLNNLYRYFLPGAALVSYTRWRFQMSPFPGSGSDGSLVAWSVFVLLSLGTGGFLYLLYRGFLHPYWWVIQHRWRGIPTFAIYLYLARKLALPVQKQSTRANLRHSQVCLGNFLAKDKFRSWRKANEFRISPIHFLYLMTTVSLLIFVGELLFYLVSIVRATNTPRPSVAVLLCILALGGLALIVGEMYDRTADIYEGQFLAANVADYEAHLKETYSSLLPESFDLLHLGR